ncbi:MAG: response regulator [Desulfobacca sp.]|uniref:response regulator n=1 Tax=Desulfobacca sp. TaxID=2067990 RepID=UPI00404B9115
MATPRVLIVDDERNIRLTLKGALEAIGLEVDAVFQGEEALQKLSDSRYDAMLLDLRLPGMDGLAVLRQVMARFPQTRVIIITAYGTVEAVLEAMRLGAVDFLQKPFEPEEVREIIGRALARDAGRPVDFSYEEYLGLAQKHIAQKKFSAAFVYAHKAVLVSPDRPEAFNIMGGLYENRDQRKEALTNYQVALKIDPSYGPAQKNLQRLAAKSDQRSGIVWG